MIVLLTGATGNSDPRFGRRSSAAGTVAAVSRTGPYAARLEQARGGRPRRRADLTRTSAARRLRTFWAASRRDR